MARPKKVDKFDRANNVALTYKFLKEGKSMYWIEDFFKEHQQLKPITVKHYLIDARKLIATEADMDVDFTGALHDARYEQIWEEDKNAYVNWFKNAEEPYQRAANADVIRKYNSLLTAMKQRENMYGLRDKDLVFALHSNLTLTKDSTSVSFEEHLRQDFDIDKLTIQEKSELLKLLELSYEGDIFEEQQFIVDDDEDEVKEVKIKKTNRLTSTSVIKESFNNIKDQPKPPKEKVKRITGSVKVIDATKGDKGKDTESINQAMKKSMLEEVKKKFKKKS